jgi:4-amino-4-deoxy-L-arabinose transferase-like glycosyltransferase
VALFSVFVVWRAQTAVNQAQDIYRFAEMGRSIAEGHGLAYGNGAPTMRRAPLYPGLIALLYLVFGVHPVVILVAQCLLAAGTCLLAFEIGQRVFSPNSGYLAAALTALHPMIMRYVPDIQVEVTLTFLYTLSVFCAVRFYFKPSGWNGFAFGVASALAALVKGVALPFPVLFVGAYLVYRLLKRREQPFLPAIPATMAVFLAMAVVILPWTYRNYQLTGGRFVLISSNAGGEFLRGYVFAQPKYFLLQQGPYVEGENEANNMQRELFKSQGLVWERDETETEQVQNLAAKKQLASDPIGFVRKFAIGWFAFWYLVTSRTNSLVVGSLALAAWLLTLIGVLRMRSRAERHPFWVLLVPIFALNGLYAAVLALGRYSAPCIPTLMVLAAWGFARCAGNLPKPTSRARQPLRSSDFAA